MKLLRFLFYRLYQLMISVGNGDVAEYYAIILMSTLLWVNLISLISFIDIFTGQSINIYFGSKIMILLEYFIITCIFYSLFIRKKQYLDIAKDYENESIKERIMGKAFAICYFILSLALMIFGFYLMMMKNRGELQSIQTLCDIGQKMMGTSNLWQQNLNNMIKNFYYSVWTDCILQFQKGPIKKHWKFWSMFYISIAMGVNYMFLAALIPSKLLIPLLRLDIFHVKIIDIFLSSLIYFFSPWIFLNYFLIFWGNKYKKIIVNHRFRNGKLFLNYFFFSLFTPCLSLMIYYIIQKSK